MPHASKKGTWKNGGIVKHKPSYENDRPISCTKNHNTGNNLYLPLWWLVLEEKVVGKLLYITSYRKATKIGLHSNDGKAMKSERKSDRAGERERDVVIGMKREKERERRERF